MRTKPAKKWNSDAEHNQYGIYNWFKNHKGIKDKEIIMECVANFCQKEGMEITSKIQERTMMNFAGNRFQKFASFAAQYLIQNNYINN